MKLASGWDQHIFPITLLQQELPAARQVEGHNMRNI